MDDYDGYYDQLAAEVRRQQDRLQSLYALFRAGLVDERTFHKQRGVLLGQRPKRRWWQRR